MKVFFFVLINKHNIWKWKPIDADFLRLAAKLLIWKNLYLHSSKMKQQNVHKFEGSI